MINVLFVCLGNICRSPTAEGLFRDIIAQQGLTSRISVDSAGTSDWHIGQAPDQRAQETARSHGIDIGSLRGRQVADDDFKAFDFILAMDTSNFRKLESICPLNHRNRLDMFLSFAPELGFLDVPDPYYDDGFEMVFEMLALASHGLLNHIQSRDDFCVN